MSEISELKDQVKRLTEELQALRMQLAYSPQPQYHYYVPVKYSQYAPYLPYPSYPSYPNYPYSGYGGVYGPAQQQYIGQVF